MFETGSIGRSPVPLHQFTRYQHYIVIHGLNAVSLGQRKQENHSLHSLNIDDLMYSTTPHESLHAPPPATRDAKWKRTDSWNMKKQ